MEYRIHQKEDYFFIQKKTIFGWIYEIEKIKDNNIGIFFMISGLITFIVFTIMSAYIMYIYSTALLLISCYAIFFNFKVFSNLEDAKSYIENNFKIKKISKFYYLDIKAERKDKLKKILK